MVESSNGVVPIESAADAGDHCIEVDDSCSCSPATPAGFAAVGLAAVVSLIRRRTDR